MVVNIFQHSPQSTAPVGNIRCKAVSVVNSLPIICGSASLHYYSDNEYIKFLVYFAVLRL